MASNGEQTGSCYICGKTAEQRIAEHDRMNYHYTERAGNNIVYRNKCRDCFYGGRNK